MQPECLQGTKRCIRRDLSLNRQIIIFLIEPITGWLLRPIFRLILTGYIYSRYMYDGIEHLTMVRVMRPYTNYVLHLGSRISKHLQTKVPKVRSNLSI